MHEVGIAQEIIKIVNSYLVNENNIKVTSIKLDVGDFCNIQTESLIFGFDVLTKETLLEGAKLDIKKIPLKIKCKICDFVSILEEPFFYCTKCNSSNVEILTGTELNIIEIVLKD